VTSKSKISLSLSFLQWSYQLGNGCEYGICGWGNNEHQYYTNSSKNSAVEGGRLIVKSRHEVGSDREQLQKMCRSRCGGNDNCKAGCSGVGFSSARIRTAGKFSVAPGSKGYSTIRISARIKVSPGEGLWPAIWLLPEVPEAKRCSGCGRYGVWASSGEIDVFEAVNGMNEVMGSIHYGNPWPNNQYQTSKRQIDPNLWHTVTFIWRNSMMEWYMDGERFGEMRSGGGTQNGWYSAGAGAGANSPFDTKFHLLINMAIGGGLTGNIPAEGAAATLTDPKSFQVDWIRVYAR
jgi:beta-glucanase (GH16 family)